MLDSVKTLFIVGAICVTLGTSMYWHPWAGVLAIGLACLFIGAVWQITFAAWLVKDRPEEIDG